MHPAVLESYTAGELLASLQPAVRPASVDGFSPLEVCVLGLLRKRLQDEPVQLRPAV
jgi:hypothetical protein